jgi:hypothetical protein
LGTYQFSTPFAVQFRELAGGVVVVIVLLCYFASLFKKGEVLMPNVTRLIDFARILAPVVTAAQQVTYYGCTLWQWLDTKELAFRQLNMLLN